MIAVIAAAALATAGPAASTSPSVNSAPLREVVYTVSYTRRRQLNAVAYGDHGTSGDNMAATANEAPVAQNASVTDDGTVTVDVMAVANNALGIKLVESCREHPRPQIFLGSIAPDGSLNFGTQPISEVSSDLLPFFGPLLSNGKALDVGLRWTVNADNSWASFSTTYAVTSVDDNGVTIAETQTLKAKGARGMNSSVSGTIVYHPNKLVPISGKVVMHSSRDNASGTNIDDTVVNFSRTSDTLEPAK